MTRTALVSRQPGLVSSAASLTVDASLPAHRHTTVMQRLAGIKFNYRWADEGRTVENTCQNIRDAAPGVS